MVYQWEPDTYYGPGSVVLFEGAQYQIIQPHTSEANWTPPATPALWGRLPQEVQVNQPPPPPPNYGSQQNWDSKQQEMPLPPSTGNGGYQSGEVQIPQEEQKKHWYDLDEERKKQLLIGGGLAAGAALLGGGFLAYRNHKNKSEDEKNALTWSLQNWVHEAKERRHNYEKHGLGNQPYAWVLNRGTDIPQGAIVGGQQNGEPMYVCRAFFEGGLHIGKVGRSFQKGGCIGFANEEIHAENYEILVGDMRALQWIRVSGALNLSALGRRPIEGGRESDGTPLYVAQGFLQDGPHPGKAGPHLNGANIPYNGHEEFTAEYLVLCWA